MVVDKYTYGILVSACKKAIASAGYNTGMDWYTEQDHFLPSPSERSLHNILD